MKQITYITLFFISALSYAQNSGSISGSLLDAESNYEPLTLATVILKETGAKVLCNDEGYFKFDNLKNGKYTLVSSFIGYETKETIITVASNASNINLTLSARTITLEDLVTTMAGNNNKASRL
ncbi:carboxypeptidase-like regulatory domain-containing protein [Algibacter pectinivorans]|uniref:CarboxypepD_reg-like domain-containing protein n=1 Tax=Algibacter pectinivorans TaxID=870482 RepID=A0A1I1MWK3_9FLAO|nr:carboxypeptidase-like regulatory domain-containing protein [Algibacter pectinivorans]SFC89282.1 CarboxypepD_reg-like domain-containing protein [Algibacter pectinivorans]